MRILNPDHEPYLDFAEEERRGGKRQFSPWTTTDPKLLAFARRYFPEIPIIPAERLEKPDLSPVEILPLREARSAVQQAQEPCFIAVGGPPAAAVALEQALQGQAVLYASDLKSEREGKESRPIWAGAGNHGEPDALTEGPAYIAGHEPLAFILREIGRAFLPVNYQTQVLQPDFLWLSLNLSEWLRHPRQWPAAFRVFWGNFLLSLRFRRENQAGREPEVLRRMRQRTRESWIYLEDLHKKIGLFREPRGSLLIAASPRQAAGYQRDAAFLQAEGLRLFPLTEEKALEKYGVAPRQPLALMEKAHDFIFEPDFLSKMTAELQKQGGEVKNHWRLRRVYVDTDQELGGVMEFIESGKRETLTHYRRFSRAHLSLGPTPYQPNFYDLISVTGVSMNALLFGANLKGGPLVCGGSNHVVPLLPPRLIEGQMVTFARLSAAGCVSPLDRGPQWYHYDGRHAVHLLHRVRETLPPEITIRLLSVTGCNRVIGKDGQQMEVHPTLRVKGKKKICSQVTIQVGAGGGGLTQMGAVPSESRKKYENS